MAKVIQTRVEERDGKEWVTGLCPYCWERVAVAKTTDELPASAECPNGHVLAVLESHSAGDTTSDEGNAPRPWLEWRPLHPR
jgi:hypothetical protein